MEGVGIFDNLENITDFKFYIGRTPVQKIEFFTQAKVSRKNGSDGGAESNYKAWRKLYAD